LQEIKYYKSHLQLELATEVLSNIYAEIMYKEMSNSGTLCCYYHHHYYHCQVTQR